MGDSIRVAVCGAAGRMGREVVRAVVEAPDLQLVGAVDRVEIGRDAAELAQCAAMGIAIRPDLEEVLNSARPRVLVDFTQPAAALANIRTALAHSVSPVVGTTGLAEKDLDQVALWVRDAGIGAVVAPNFALGAVLMMQFAQQAARYLPDVEIIELHHERKLDAPSGTALLTARKISQARSEAGVTPVPSPEGAFEHTPGARGGSAHGVPIHSIRLPGLVAHQEVLFGAPGQTLSIRHDSTDRRCFMPGVLLAIRKVIQRKDLVIGLENLLD
ncbi:MAG: 4-hydroxy-tetrahydrodipicolinate reductase [Chthonomonadales bacterium]